MEKNTNKIFAGLLALSCAFVLGACDPVTAYPASYNDPILQGADEIKDNIAGKIYDAISSNRDDKVLQKILDEIVTDKYGTYEQFVKACSNDTERTNFINSHSEIFIRKGDTPELQVARFNQFKEDVNKRISEAFYNLITSNSFNDPKDGMFDEQELYASLKKELWDLQAAPTSWKKFYVTSEITKDNAFNYLTKSLYSYPESQALTGNVPEGYKARGYIDKKVYPEILKDKFVEEYIFNNNYAAIGRSYARKVNYVKINWTISTSKYIDYVTNSFVDNFIYATGEEELYFDYIDKAILGFSGINPEAGEDEPLIKLTNGQPYTNTYNDKGELVDYVTYSSEVNQNFYESISGKPDCKDMVAVNAGDNPSDFTTIDNMPIFDENFEAYPDTKLGELLDSYNKALTARDAGFMAKDDDKAELEKFSSGKSLADSLRDKILALAKEDNTTNGWFVKNGGLNDLPNALRDRLFNINVANDLDIKWNKTDKKGYKEEKAEDKDKGTYRYDGEGTEGNMIKRMPYCRNIEGKKLVMAAEADPFDQNHNNFIFNDGSAYYICQVLEAPSTAKLDAENAKAYKTSAGTVDFENIELFAREICKILSTKDTYVKNAYTKYLQDNNYEFTFYDTNLYEYFKTQYPDLFED